MRDLSVINVEKDCYLLSLDHLLATYPLYRLILYPYFMRLFKNFL